MNPPETKHCPICTQDLPVNEFGICRARKDGKNLYCKSCIRIKVMASRRALKEYKQALKCARQDRYWRQFETRQPVIEINTRQPLGPVIRLSPVDRVREAIRNGCRTQREIGIETKLGKDEVGNALAELLLWTSEIRTQVEGDTRIYFLNVAQGEEIEVERKPDVLGGFHTIKELAPGRRVREVA